MSQKHVFPTEVCKQTIDNFNEYSKVNLLLYARENHKNISQE